MNSVIPGATLRLVGYSDDILPIQAKFENKKGQATCTERDFKEIYQSELQRDLSIKRSIVSKNSQDHVADD